MAIVTRGSLIVADVIVIAVTWVRLSGSIKEAFKVTRWHAAAIRKTMLVDGENKYHSRQHA